MRLGTKFTFLVTGILAVTLGLTSLYLILSERQAAHEQLRQHSGAQGRLLSLIAPDAIIGYNFILLNEYTAQITRDPDVVYAAVFDTRGGAITSYLDRHDPVIAAVLAAKPESGVGEVRRALGSISHVMVETLPIASDGRPLGELVIATDTRRVDQELAWFAARQAAAYLAIIVLLAAAIVAVFRLNVLAPVKALMRGARRVSRGDYEQKVEILRPDELGTLTAAFNAMMAEIKDEREQLHRQANFDALTGLPNRKMAMDRIRHEIERARRDGSGFALLFIDLDNFKYVNDTMGHVAGDQLLIEIGRRFKEQIRAIDLLARLGGDEYLVLMPGVTAGEAALTAGQRLFHASTLTARINETDVYSRCSIGIAFFPSDGEEAEALMAAADSAMYAAKRNAGSPIQFYTNALNEAARRRVEVERDIYAALEHQEFFLVFQPVVRVCDNSYVGAEVLLRWRHPHKGVLGPDEFIPVAEQTGQIVSVGAWVLGQACAAAAELKRSGLASGSLAINVSCHQLKRGFEQVLEGALRRGCLANQELVLEITESAVMGEDRSLTDIFSFLREHNIKVALDDFGTGFSSLGNLSRFRFNTIKIDKSFVEGLPDNLQARSVVAAIIAIAKNLEMDCVAEGVETEAQRQALLELGCGYYQGFLHRRPMLLDEFRAYLQRAAPSVRKVASE